MKKLKKIYQLLFNGIRYDPKILTLFLWHLFFPTKATSVQEYTDQEILDEIKKGTSFLRLGDGEALILTGRDIYFQKTSKKLANNLKEIINSYSHNHNYIIGIPTNKLPVKENKLPDKKNIKIWRLFRIIFRYRFHLNKKYAPLTYFYKQYTFEKKIAPLLKNYHIVCISNRDTLDDKIHEYMNKNFKKVSFVYTTKRNAFQNSDNIKSDINKKIKESNLVPILLFSAGPAGKV